MARVVFEPLEKISNHPIEFGGEVLRPKEGLHGMLRTDRRHALDHGKATRL